MHCYMFCFSSGIQCLFPLTVPVLFDPCCVSSQIFWSDSGELVCIGTEESFFILRYMSEKVATSQETNEGVTEDGIEDAFEVRNRSGMNKSTEV